MDQYDCFTNCEEDYDTLDKELKEKGNLFFPYHPNNYTQYHVFICKNTNSLSLTRSMYGHDNFFIGIRLLSCHNFSLFELDAYDYVKNRLSVYSDVDSMPLCELLKEVCSRSVNNV